MKEDTNNCTRDIGLKGRCDIRCFLIDKYGRDIKGMWGRDKMIIGDWYWRMCKKGFLKAYNGWVIRGKDMTKVRSVGAETANIPMKDSYTFVDLVI